jgi:hypothetical protein
MSVPKVYYAGTPNHYVPVQCPNKGCVGAVPIIAVVAPNVPAGSVIQVNADTVFNNHDTVNASVVCGVKPWVAIITSSFDPYVAQGCDGYWTGSDCTPAMPYIPFTRTWSFPVTQTGDYYCALSGYAGSDAAPGWLGVWEGQTRLQAVVFPGSTS